MKKYIYLFIVTIFLSSCDVDEFLDVKPTGIVIPEDVEHYDDLLGDPLIGANNWKNLIYLDPDAYVTDIQYDYIESDYFRNQCQWASDHYGVNTDYDYKSRYKYLYVYNLIIDEIDDANLGTKFETDRTRVKGEAYGQRAMDLFILVNEYAPHYDPANDAPGIPMPLKPDLEAQLSKSSVHEVYDQIESDLKVAEELLKDHVAFNSNENFRPGIASIKGLLALVKLYKGEFELAAQYASESLALYDFVYDFKEFELDDTSSDWEDLLYNGSVFEEFYYATDTKSAVWCRGNVWHYFYDGVSISYHPDLEALFDKDNDQRWLLFSSTTTDKGDDLSPYYAYARGYNQNNSGISVSNLILIKAEALARTGDGPGAIDALNGLLEKRIFNFTPLTHTSDAATLQIVKDERRKELMSTGFNLIDLKRYYILGEDVPTFTRTIKGQTYTLKPGSSKYYCPIPKVVSDMNPNL